MTPLNTPPNLWLPATHDETAPRSLPIRVKEQIKPKKDYTHNPASELQDETARRNIATSNHQRGFDVDVNLLPLDKLFR